MTQFFFFYDCHLFFIILLSIYLFCFVLLFFDYTSFRCAMFLSLLLSFHFFSVASFRLRLGRLEPSNYNFFSYRGRFDWMFGHTFFPFVPFSSDCLLLPTRLSCQFIFFFLRANIIPSRRVVFPCIVSHIQPPVSQSLYLAFVSPSSLLLPFPSTSVLPLHPSLSILFYSSLIEWFK